jgi:hypothetical protein
MVGMPGVIIDRRYSTLWASNNVDDGIDTIRIFLSLNNFAASTARDTSDPVATKIKSAYYNMHGYNIEYHQHHGHHQVE